MNSTILIILLALAIVALALLLQYGGTGGQRHVVYTYNYDL